MKRSLFGSMACLALIGLSPATTRAEQVMTGEYSARTCCESTPGVCAAACNCDCDCDCLACRTRLTGDWFGHRSQLSDNGIVFDFDATQFYFGTADGGTEQLFRYAGHNDYVVNIDGGKLGVQEGLFIKLRAEHRYGESLGATTGAFLPSTVLTDLPTPISNDIHLTNVMFTQALSESFALFAGKIDTLDGDPNAFASGRGKMQFSNLAFVVNPLLLRTVPYASLGAGFVILRDLQPLFTFTVINPTNTIGTSGFNELFADGASLNAELRLPTQFLDRPGHQLFGGSWSSRDYVSLGQDPRIILPDVPIERSSGSWALYWNFDQYLVVDPCDAAKGWGVFGRAAIGDDNSNPLASFLSFGVGGSSPIQSRPSDTFGVGWYYVESSDQIGPILNTLFGPVGDSNGVELFYNVAVTPWFHLTPDLQVIQPARENIDTAVVAGLRGQLQF